jgi:capsular polysaccharide biosynthesis protein
MSDIYYLLVGMVIGLGMRVLMALLDVAIKEIEKHVPRP